jgi:hypothetical protein
MARSCIWEEMHEHNGPLPKEVSQMNIARAGNGVPRQGALEGRRAEQTRIQAQNQADQGRAQQTQRQGRVRQNANQETRRTETARTRRTEGQRRDRTNEARQERVQQTERQRPANPGNQVNVVA